MEGMFLNCTSLKTIYISDLWNNQKMLNYSGNPYQPFTGCTSLVGVIPYDSTLNTMKQANSETGYFTLKRQTVGIKPLYEYISSLNGVKSLEITLNKNYSKSYYVDDLSLNHNENANLYVIGDKAYLNLTKRITLQEDITNLFKGIKEIKNFDKQNQKDVSLVIDNFIEI